MRAWWSLLFLTTVSLMAQEVDEPELKRSTPEQIATLRGVPSAMVDGKIYAPTGALCLQRTDLIARGAQPVSLERFYSAPLQPEWTGDPNWEAWHLYKRTPPCGGWSCLAHISLKVEGDWPKRVTVSEPNGMTLEYLVDRDGSTRLSGDPLGMHNVGPEGPSAMFDPANTRIEFGADGITVILPDGGWRLYRSLNQRWYQLVTESLPSGKRLNYEYDQRQVARVYSSDPHGHHLYAELRIDPDQPIRAHQTGTGLSCEHRWALKGEKRRFKEGKQRMEYEVSMNLLQSAASPYFSEEVFHYSPHLQIQGVESEGESFRCHYDRSSGLTALAKRLEGSDVVTHRFAYDRGEPGQSPGRTTVTREDGSSAIYSYSKEMRLTSIHHCDKEGPRCEERFEWSDRGWLLRTSLCDRNGSPLWTKSFIYDARGDPIIETLMGDLTGDGSFSLDTIHRTFNERHLPMSESHAKGLVLEMEYLPGTNLLTCRVQRDAQQIWTRETWEYDDCHNCIEKRHEDEFGELRIERFHLRQEAPFLHMVDTIEELSGEGLLRRTRLHYNQHGQIEQRDHYDANGEFLYSTFQEWDEGDHLLSETNALGQEATHRYDAHGRLVYSMNYARDLETHRHYDDLGRLTAIEEGLHRTQLEYDMRGRKTGEVDYLGCETRYDRDLVYDTPLQEHRPPVASPNGSLPVTLSHRLDDYGRVVDSTDPSGHATTTSYNARGQPTMRTHPDGSQEKWLYTPSGELASYTDAEGLTLEYSRDVLGRPLSITYVGIGEKRFTYSGYRLLSETDLEGYTTRYLYDLAGRRIGEERAGRTKSWVYDARGQIAREQQGELTTDYTYDLLSRETSISHEGKLFMSYGYDAAGNRTRLCRHRSEELVDTEEREYDPWGRLLRRTDPLGNTTLYAWSEEEHLLTRIEQRPGGTSRCTRWDQAGRIVEERTCNEAGATLSAQSHFYNPSGDRVEQREEVYIGTTPERTLSTRWEYDACHRVVRETQSDSRTHLYEYTPSGHLERDKVEGGVTRVYGYSPLGHLTSQETSDGSCSYLYECNNLGHLVAMQDLRTGRETRRQVDPWGQILAETSPEGQEIRCEYDALGRVTQIIYPDRSRVDYLYRDRHLESVERSDESSRLLYSHTYLRHDYQGQPLLERLPSGGLLESEYDGLGRRVAISSPHFSQRWDRLDEEGRPSHISEENGSFSLTYDPLSQLTSDGFRGYSYDSCYNHLDTEVDALHQIASPGYRYDEEGRLIETPAHRIAYDGLDRLISFDSTSYGYDPLGRRTARDSETFFHYGDWDLGSASTCRVVHPQTGQTLAVENLGYFSRSTLIPVHDLVWNVRCLIDLSGQVKERCRYSAFGIPSTPLSIPWGFSDHRQEGPLVLTRARAYMPTLARWCTPDPDHFRDSMNLYQYCLNNPFQFRDPEGRFVFVLAIPLTFTAAGLAKATVVAAVTAAVAYGSQKTYEYYERERQRKLWEGHNTTYYPRESTPTLDEERDDNDPPGETWKDAVNDGWKDESHPEQKEAGHHVLRDPKTGEKWRFDEGRPGKPGHGGRDHWHRHNPDGKPGGPDEYLDRFGNPCRDGSGPSHIYYTP